MAGNHILLPYKLFDAISNSKLSAPKSWQFIIALVNYERYNELPDFPHGKENALWLMLRPELDRNKKNWKEEVKRRSNAGKKGGSSTSEKKASAARENGRRGGAPLGNRNAAKTTQADNENVNDLGNDLDHGNANDLDQDNALGNPNDTGLERKKECLMNPYKNYRSPKASGNLSCGGKGKRTPPGCPLPIPPVGVAAYSKR